MTVDDSYLSPGRFVDSDAPDIVAFAQRASAGAGDEIERAVRINRAVRDEITYDPYVDYMDIQVYRASSVLAAGRGYCVGKAAVLAACARSVGIPARLGFADVRNHLSSPKLYEVFKTDVFRWHAYVDLHVGGKWVKATPAFDARLCAKLNLAPLDFDGRSDSLFQPFDPAGRRHMEYLADHGTFADVPVETLLEQLRLYYPALYDGAKLSGDFASEAVAG
jgi:transglutaminase-like putative cysteine protease